MAKLSAERKAELYNQAHIVLKNVRLSYVKLFEPEIASDGSERFSARVLVPKTDTDAKEKINEAIKAATELAQDRYGSSFPDKPKTSVHDGDGVRPSDGQPFGEENKGHWIFTASSKTKPGLLNQYKQPAIEEDIYSGVYAHVGLTFFGYNAGMNKGIGVAITNVMKAKDGERFGGTHYSIDADFGDIEGEKIEDELGDLF